MKKFYSVVLFCAFASIAFGQASWTKLDGDILGEGAGFPSVLMVGDSYHMWYAVANADGILSISHATSDDGLIWDIDPLNPVIESGAFGEWDSLRVYLPNVLYVDSTFHMWFVGANASGNENLGYATSADGSSWTKYESNPVGKVGDPSDWDSGTIGSGGFFHDGSLFHLWYSASSLSSSNFDGGYATSEDGINWTRASENPVIVDGGTGSWDSPRLQPSCVVARDGGFDLWYSAGDFSTWQIGYARSTDGLEWVKDDLNPVIAIGESGSYDDYYTAFPSVLYDATTGKFKMWYSAGSDYLVGTIAYAESAPVGVNSEGFNAREFSIYPNPARDLVNISSPVNEPYSLLISSLNGQALYYTQMQGNLQQIDIGFLVEGMYFVTLKSGNSVHTKKMIIQR